MMEIVFSVLGNEALSLSLHGEVSLHDAFESVLEPHVAGRVAELAPGPMWWDCVDRCEWPEGLEKEMDTLWDAEHGDRQQVSCMS